MADNEARSPEEKERDRPRCDRCGEPVGIEQARETRFTERRYLVWIHSACATAWDAAHPAQAPPPCRP